MQFHCFFKNNYSLIHFIRNNNTFSYFSLVSFIFH